MAKPMELLLLESAPPMLLMVAGVHSTFEVLQGALQGEPKPGQMSGIRLGGPPRPSVPVGLP